MVHPSPDELFDNPLLVAEVLDILEEADWKAQNPGREKFDMME